MNEKSENCSSYSSSKSTHNSNPLENDLTSFVNGSNEFQKIEDASSLSYNSTNINSDCQIISPIEFPILATPSIIYYHNNIRPNLIGETARTKDIISIDNNTITSGNILDIKTNPNNILLKALKQIYKSIKEFSNEAGDSKSGLEIICPELEKFITIFTTNEDARLPNLEGKEKINITPPQLTECLQRLKDSIEILSSIHLDFASTEISDLKRTLLKLYNLIGTFTKDVSSNDAKFQGDGESFAQKDFATLEIVEKKNEFLEILAIDAIFKHNGFDDEIRINIEKASRLNKFLMECLQNSIPLAIVNAIFDNYHKTGFFDTNGYAVELKKELALVKQSKDRWERLFKSVRSQLEGRLEQGDFEAGGKVAHLVARLEASKLRCDELRALMEDKDDISKNVELRVTSLISGLWERLVEGQMSMTVFSPLRRECDEGPKISSDRLRCNYWRTKLKLARKEIDTLRAEMRTDGEGDDLTRVKTENSRLRIHMSDLKLLQKTLELSGYCARNPDFTTKLNLDEILRKLKHPSIINTALLVGETGLKKQIEVLCHFRDALSKHIQKSYINESLPNVVGNETIEDLKKNNTLLQDNVFYYTQMNKTKDEELARLRKLLNINDIINSENSDLLINKPQSQNNPYNHSKETIDANNSAVSDPSSHVNNPVENHNGSFLGANQRIELENRISRLNNTTSELKLEVMRNLENFAKEKEELISLHRNQELRVAKEMAKLRGDYERLLGIKHENEILKEELTIKTKISMESRQELEIIKEHIKNLNLQHDDKLMDLQNLVKEQETVLIGNEKFKEGKIMSENYKLQKRVELLDKSVCQAQSKLLRTRSHQTKLFNESVGLKNKLAARESTIIRLNAIIARYRKQKNSNHFTKEHFKSAMPTTESNPPKSATIRPERQLNKIAEGKGTTPTFKKRNSFTTNKRYIKEKSLGKFLRAEKPYVLSSSNNLSLTSHDQDDEPVSKSLKSAKFLNTVFDNSDNFLSAILNTEELRIDQPNITTKTLPNDNALLKKIIYQMRNHMNQLAKTLSEKCNPSLDQKIIEKSDQYSQTFGDDHRENIHSRVRSTNTPDFNQSKMAENVTRSNLPMAKSTQINSVLASLKDAHVQTCDSDTINQLFEKIELLKDTNDRLNRRCCDYVLDVESLSQEIQNFRLSKDLTKLNLTPSHDDQEKGNLSIDIIESDDCYGDYHVTINESPATNDIRIKYESETSHDAINKPYYDVNNSYKVKDLILHYESIVKELQRALKAKCKIILNAKIALKEALHREKCLQSEYLFMNNKLLNEKSIHQNFTKYPPREPYGDKIPSRLLEKIQNYDFILSENIDLKLELIDLKKL